MPRSLYRRLAIHMTAAALLVVLFAAPDYLYRWFEPGYHGRYNLAASEWYLVVAVLLMGVQWRPALCGFLGFFALLQLAQLFHFAYFGTQISPLEVGMLFTEADEIWLSLRAIVTHLAYPTAVVAVCSGLAYLLWARLHQHALRIAPAPLLLTALLCVLPYRAYKSEHSQAFYPNPGALALSNSLYAVSFALGRAFRDEQGAGQRYLPYTVASRATTDLPNVIVVMGESLTWRHMGLFGYARATTPELVALKDDPNFVYKTAIAGGVATKVSLPQFFNVQRESGNLRHLIRYESNLLKLARAHHYATYFISAQTANLMTYAGVEFADRFVTRERLGNDYKTLKDDVLLQQLRQIDLATPAFIVLHQRNSHGPYEQSYPEAFAKYPVAGLPYADYVTNAYDNSVTYTDHLLAQLISDVRSRSTRPTYIVFTSDHGEMIGEDGRYGHGFLAPNVLKVPFLFYAVRGAQRQIDAARALVTPTHYEIAMLIAGLIGFEINNPNAVPGRYYATGSDVGGAMGCRAIEKDAASEDGWKFVSDPLCRG